MMECLYKYCRECIFNSDFGNGLYRCTNHDSIHYMEYTDACCGDECNDGEYLASQEQEKES